LRDERQYRSHGSGTDGAEQPAAVVRTHGRRAWVAPLDLSTAEQAGQDARALVVTLGGLDILVLCAGHDIVTPYREIRADEWAAVLNANLTGAFFSPPGDDTRDPPGRQRRDRGQRRRSHGRSPSHALRGSQSRSDQPHR
jgi:hypothetical protein